QAYHRPLVAQLLNVRTVGDAKRLHVSIQTDVVGLRSSTWVAKGAEAVFAAGALVPSRVARSTSKKAETQKNTQTYDPAANSQSSNPAWIKPATVISANGTA